MHEIFSHLEVATILSKMMKDHGSLPCSPTFFEDPLERVENAVTASVLM